MDRFEREALAEIPDGYAIIRSGPILPDDLLFVYPGGGFMRADSTEWTGTAAIDAEDAVLCIRKGKAPDMPGATRRTYHLPRTTPEKTLQDPATPETASRSLPDQLSLFV